MTFIRNLIVNGLVALVSLTLVFGGAEWGYSVFKARRVRTYFDEQAVKTLGDPVPKKQPNEYRIFIFGSSSAYGFPVSDRYSIASWLEKSFAHLLPSRKVKVVNCGWPGKSSHQALEGARTVMKYKPDLFIIYCGHNEATVSNRLFLDNWLYRLNMRVYYLSAAYRYLDIRLNHLRKYLLYGRSGYAEKQYREEVIANKVYKKIEVDEPEYKRIAEGYRKNMEAVIRTAKRHGVQVMFLNMPSNLRDSPPVRSVHREGLSKEQLSQWSVHFRNGERLFRKGRFAPALQAYGLAYKIDPDYAELSYRMGLAYEKLGMFDASRTFLIRARDTDGQPWRAKTELNEIIRNLVDTHHLELVDAVGVLEKFSPHGLVGNNLIFDNVHPTVQAQQIITDEILRILSDKGMIAPATEWQWEDFRKAREGDEAKIWNVGGSEQAYHYVLHGLHLWEQRRYEETVQNLEKGIQLMPAYHESYAFLGDAYWQIGKQSQAAAAFRTLKENDGRLLDQLLKKYPDIASTYQKVLNIEGDGKPLAGIPAVSKT